MKSKPTTGKPALLKKINKNLITKLIVKHGTISRSELAKMTNLALVSVMRLVDELIAEGLVMEIGKGNSTGGRKPSLLTLNKDHRYIVGIEIAIKTYIVITDLSGSIIDKWESKQMAYLSPYEMLETINEKMEAMITGNKIDRDKIAGVGIGTPGSNFKHLGTVKHSILKGWEEIDVKEWFENKSDLLFIVDNVARTRTLSELWFGKGRELQNFIYIFVDQGVGCGIVNNQAIYEGTNSVAGEFGHTVISLDGRECYCGNKGCIEMYVSAGAITSEAAELLDIVDNDFKFKEVIENSERDGIAEILKKSGRILGVGIANLINVYNPEAVILGGIVISESKIFAESAIGSVSANIFSNNAVSTPIYLSEINDNRVCIGSVALVINTLFKTIEL